MKYYVVIDTNVLVSAMLKVHSVPGSIVDLAFDGSITPVLNESIEKEYRAVLSRPKFHLPDDLIEDIINTFQQRGIYVDAEELDIELPDPKDLVFYEVVMEWNAYSILDPFFWTPSYCRHFYFWQISGFFQVVVFVLYYLMM